MRTRRPCLAWLALVACSCDGHALDRLGRALAIVALIGAVAALVCLVLYILAWIHLVVAFARARRGGGAREEAIPLWWRGLAVAVLHVPMLALGIGLAATTPLATLVLTLTVPVLAVLVVTATFAARRGTRWPAFVTAGIVAVAPATAAWHYLRRPLAELPGQIAQLAAEELLACARLTTGQIACFGANWDGQRGDGREHAAEFPTLVRGVDDATAIAVGGPVACALRRDHPATCWGGKDDLPVPGDPRLPWLLPGGEVATMLAVSERSVATLGPDHVLRTWPDPPPAGLQRARLLAGDHDFDGGWFCVVEETGALACWQIASRGPREPIRWPDPPPIQALAVDADAELACALTDAGDVRCYDLDDGRPARALDGLGLRMILAADDDGTFCGQDPAGRLLCWRGDDPPRELADLRGADALAGGAGAVCGRIGDARRCVQTGARAHDKAAALLARDVLP